MLVVNNLFSSYSNELILNDVSFNFDGGSFLGIVGPNGSGKSTLLKCLLGLKSIDKGFVQWKSILPSRDISYVPQLSEFDWQFPYSVYDLVESALLTKLNFWRFKSKDYEERVINVLEKFDLINFKDNHISELSGGQKQRMLLARAFVSNPKLLILDEPFNAVDHYSELHIMSLLKDYVKKGGSVIMVHHNLNSSIEYFNHVLLLNKKVIAFGETKSVLNKNNFEKAYGNFFSDL